MEKQKLKFVLILFLSVFLSGCATSKKDLQLELAFKEYLNNRNIKYEKNDSIYSNYYSDFLKYETKKTLSINPFIKLNNIYIHEGPNKITFCIFSDDGNEYLARIFKADSSVLTESENDVIKLKQTIKLEFLGNFELTDTIIKISRNIRELSGKEWNECDVGVIQKNAIRLIENYDTKKYSYKKRWLKKTYKTNFKLVYQSSLKATRYESDKTHNAYYLIEGSFNLNEN